MLRRVAAAAFAFAAFSATAEADVRSESMLRQFFELIDSAEGWSARTDMILSEGDDTIAEGIVITREAQPVTEIRVERLRLRDLGERRGGGFTAAEIEAANAAITGTNTGFRTSYEYAIPTAAMRGVAMPAFTELEFDPRRLMTFISRVYSLAAVGELEELSIPSIAGSIRSAGVDLGSSRIEYRNIRLTDLAGGVFASQTAGPVVGSGTNPQGEFDFRVESAGVENFDLAAFARIFDETQYGEGRGDGVWRPLASAIRYAGVALNGPNGANARLDELAVEGIDGRQTDRPFTAEWDRLLDPTVPETTKGDLALEALTHLASAWRVGTIRLAGLAAGAPGESSTLSLGQMAFTGLSSDGFDSFLMASLAGSGPEVAFALESLEVSGFVFPDIQALMHFAALENDADPATHAETVRRAFAGLPRIAHFGMGGLSLGPTPELTVTLASATLDMSGWNDIYAEATDLRIDDLMIPGALLRRDPTVAPIMDRMGFEDLVIDVTTTDRWESSRGTDDFTFGLFVQDVFDLSLSYRLQGLTVDWLIEMLAEAGKTTSDDEAIMAMMQELSLERASVQATDRSLLDRAFALAAQMQGLSVDGAAYRQQMRGALPFLLSTVVPADLARQISAPLQEFIGGGRTLVADVAPSAPLPVVELIAAAENDPTSLPGLLGLQVRTEDAE